jgi:streptomycin 6-kinase
MSLADVCARHQLELVEVLPSHYGDVARVRDRGRRDLILKARQGAQHDCLEEAEALRLWRGRGCVPHLVAVYDDGYHLREHVAGTVLTDLPGCGHDRAAEAGSLLRELHGPIGEPDGAPATWLTVEARRLAESGFLGADEKRRAAGAAVAIAEAPTVVVHGDFYHRNVLMTPRGLVIIDPLARRDAAAADMACFALTSPAADPAAVIAGMVAGYGEAPAALSAYVTFWSLRNLHFRGAFEGGGGHGSGDWQACWVAEGDGLRWSG